MQSNIIQVKDLDPFNTIKLRLTDACNYRCPYCIRLPLVRSRETTDCRQFLPAYNSLIQKMRRNGKKVKVDLIGGEITVLPWLPEFLTKLNADRINITTNASKSAQYFLDLPSKEKITLTCSYHPTECSDSIENWFYKVKEFSDDFHYVKVETVAFEENTHVARFKELARIYDIDFMVEEDLMNPRLKGFACQSKKNSPRYEITMDDGSVKTFGTRNQFLKEVGEFGTFNTSQFLCNRGVDYVYIEKGDVWTCDRKIPVQDYEPPTDWHTCRRGRCTLCGHISLRKKS